MDPLKDINLLADAMNLGSQGAGRKPEPSSGHVDILLRAIRTITSDFIAEYKFRQPTIDKFI